MKKDIFLKLARYGVIPRYSARSYLHEINTLIKTGLVKKIYKKGRVFYVLTENSLPLLEQIRKRLVAEVEMKKIIHPRRFQFYDSLLNDLRFFDHTKGEAQDFIFLGDWRLKEKVNLSQLELSQYRYFSGENYAS